MDISKINEIVRSNTKRDKYSRGFHFFKNKYVSNSYADFEKNNFIFYGSVYDEYHKKTYTAMISVNEDTRVISNLSCDCQSFISNSDLLESKMCPHVVAVALNGVENLKNRDKKDVNKDKIINPKVSFTISQLRNSNLSARLQIDGVEKKEYYDLFKSYKNDYKYYYTSSGSYIDLKDDDLENVFKLLDVLDVFDDFEKIKIPASKSMYLKSLLDDDKFNFVDGKKYIDNVLNKYDKLNKKIEVPKNLNAKLRDYQVLGFEFLTTLSNLGFGGILADDMGLGKTVQAISFLLSKKNKKSIVITPKALVFNWQNEFKKFAGDIKLGVVYGNVQKRNKVFENIDDYDVLLTTYGTYKSDLERYEKLKFDYCIIDEAQNIKNPKSEITLAVKKINAASKFALTGTPIENNLLELWSIFDFVMPRYLYNRIRFEKIFLKNNKNLAELKNMINPFILRRGKNEVLNELPDKIEHDFYVELDNEHKRAYRAFVKLIKSKILENDSDNITVFSYLTKLRVLSNCPELIVKNYNGKNAKLEILTNIVKSNKKRKILVFSQFTKALNIIKNRFDKEGISYSYLDGSTPAKSRVELVEQFNNDEDKKVFLISLKAGGTGLNLTSASMVVHFDPWFNPAVEDQASDRAHRIGQKNVVDVIRLVSKNTVEEKVIAIKDVKRELVDDVINDVDFAKNIKNLSKDEIIDLFGEME